MTHIQNLFPNLPERISGLGELAENLWWSWNPDARMLFKMVDRQAWKESGHNPDKMLKEIPAEILSRVAGDPDYLRHYDLLLSRFLYERDVPLDHLLLQEFLDVVHCIPTDIANCDLDLFSQTFLCFHLI